MNVQRAQDALDFVNWLSSRAGDVADALPPEDQHKAAVMALTLQAANTYIVAYLLGVGEGKDPFDALVAAVKGDVQLPQEAQDLISATGLGSTFGQLPDAGTSA